MVESHPATPSVNRQAATIEVVPGGATTPSVGGVENSSVAVRSPAVLAHSSTIRYSNGNPDSVGVNGCPSKAESPSQRCGTSAAGAWGRGRPWGLPTRSLARISGALTTLTSTVRHPCSTSARGTPASRTATVGGPSFATPMATAQSGSRIDSIPRVTAASSSSDSKPAN